MVAAGCLMRQCWPSCGAARRLTWSIGCGEGRFCRLAQAEGLTTTGIDPTPALLDHARDLDPDGTYLRASAEALPLPDESCDLAVFYLTLIDIPDARRALAEATRILRPGAHLLIANLSSFMTAANHDGFSRRPDHSADIHFRNYLKEQVYETAWRGIRIQNWHRPTAFYMRALPENGLTLTHFDEPASTCPDPDQQARYNHVAYFTLMEWQKPA